MPSTVPIHGPTLAPADGELYVVRWVRQDGSCVKHRYFRRDIDARRFLRKLRAGGWSAAMFSAAVNWSEVRR